MEVNAGYSFTSLGLMAVAVVVNIARSAFCGAAQLHFILLRSGFRRVIVSRLGRGLMVDLSLISVIDRVGTANTTDHKARRLRLSYRPRFRVFLRFFSRRAIQRPSLYSLGTD